MSKRMLIDATHKEETRVAVVEENRLEEFDYESAMRKPLKGNIFLAKVTRVEPSLQAAFVNYGGNRHGFLPFSEIHPDYFRIPVADQEEFLRMQQEELEAHDKLEEELEDDSDNSGEDSAQESVGDNDAEEDSSNDVDSAEGDEASESEEANKKDEESLDESSEAKEDGEDDDNRGNRRRGRRGRDNRGRRGGRGRRSHRSRRPENFGDDEAGQASRFRFNLRRKYKIQEVIKRGQIMLIQVSREERGNKGAAVSTYLSLPGRYCVLMPNSPRGGGVSRKISNYQDRKKMKELMDSMDIPSGMSVILRTAGLTRTKTEIKRDLDYLMREWNTIRELTLESTAPALVYEEADLVKRSVRDLYTRDIEEILVSGEEGHKAAKNIMKMLIPSHAKKVKLYEDDDLSLFQRYQVENQISEIGETEVTLPSGGYLVINPTEALVSVDVNSGRSTKERNIEGTALKTNLEAAEEVARQLRLRDLGGLVVIDFIDMENRRNNGKVERRMRDALANDRARVQVGRISNFGLMELSRQRLNASLSEAQFETCPHCEGRGLIRTADSASLLVLRAIEEEGARKRAAQVIVHVPNRVALFLLNYKRPIMADMEERYNLSILIRVDDDMPASVHRIEVSKPLDQPYQDTSNQDDSDGAKIEDVLPEGDEDSEGKDKKTGKSPRGKRGGRGLGKSKDKQDNTDNQDQDEKAEDQKEKPKKSSSKSSKSVKTSDDDVAEAPDTEKPKKKGRSKASDKADDSESDAKEADKPKAKASKVKKTEKVEASKEEKPKKKASKKAKSDASNDDKPDEPKDYETVNKAPKKKRVGWWNKLTD